MGPRGLLLTFSRYASKSDTASRSLSASCGSYRLSLERPVGRYLSVPISRQGSPQDGDEPLQQEDPQFPMPWIECPQVALVTSVRNGTSYAGLVYSIAHVLIIILEKGVVMWGTGGALVIHASIRKESDPKDNLMLGLIRISWNKHKYMQEPGVDVVKLKPVRVFYACT